MSTFTLGHSLCDEIEDVKTTGSFNETVVIHQLIEHLRNEFKGIDLQLHKFTPSFLKVILDKIKTLIKKSDTLKKEQLKDLAIKALKLLLSLNDQDIRIIDDILDTLITNKLVKAVDKSLKGRIKSVFKKHSP